MKKAIWTIVILLVLVVATVMSVSYFMIYYSLAPDENRTDTAAHYRLLFET